MTAATEGGGTPTNRAWKINDTENRKRYTILYEHKPWSCKPVLNFYQLTLDDIAETVGCDVSLVETVLRKIQDNFEPLGIAHRDVREALLIQIRTNGSQTSVVGSRLGDEPVEPRFLFN